MVHTLVDLLPTFLGFLGFFIYRRYFAKKADDAHPQKHHNSEPRSPDKVKTVGYALEIDAGVAGSPLSQVTEPEPCPEPDNNDYSDVSPVKKPAAVEVTEKPAEKAAEKAAGGGMCRRLIAVAIIAAYLVATAAVFFLACMQESADDLLIIGEEEVDQEFRAMVMRAKFDLPAWTEEEEKAHQEGISDDRAKTIPLNRQFMTLRGDDGQVIFYKSAYWGTVGVGTPLQTFKVVFDTGSGHLILPSTYCRSHVCKAHNRFRRGKSTTCRDIDHDGTEVAQGDPRDQITVSFGTGEVTGVFVDDYMCLTAAEGTEASKDPNCFPLRIIAATEMSEDPFLDFNFDGVLGLGLPSLSHEPEFNFIREVGKLVSGQGAQSPYTFGVFLAMHEGERSELTIGGSIRAQQAGPLLWSPVKRPEHGHWMLGLKAIYVDGEKLDFCTDGTCRAVADTGTSLLAMPSLAFPEIFERLWHRAPLEGFCNGHGPTLQFELEGNITVSMRPEDYASLEPIPKPQNKRREWFKRFFYGKGWPHVNEEQEKYRRDMFCKPLLMFMDVPEPIGPKLFILGEPVLRNYITIYDTENERVGWAKAKHTEPSNAIDLEEPSDEYWDFEEEEGAQPASMKHGVQPNANLFQRAYSFGR